MTSKGDSNDKVYSLGEVKEHNTAGSCWVIIHDEVYDVSKFLDEHPGGEEILIEQSGSYATEAFEDVGHSSDAREMMKAYRIGRIQDEDKETKERFNTNINADVDSNNASNWSGIVIPLCIILFAIAIYNFFV